MNYLIIYYESKNYDSLYQDIINFNKNKSKILYFYDEENKQLIDSDMITHIYITDDIYYNGFDISKYKNQYKYIYYINNINIFDLNIVDFNTIESIFDSHNKINQILFTQENQVIEYNFDDEYDIYELIKPIFKRRVKNIYSKKNTVSPNIVNYMSKKYDNFYGFKLSTCIINIQKIQDIFYLIPKTIGERFLKIYQKENKYETFIMKTELKENTKIIIKNKIRPNESITIVTGYIFVNKKSLKKSNYDYLEQAVATLKIPENMVIYVSEEYYTFVYNLRVQFNLLDKTKIIMVSEKDLYMFNKFDKIKENCEKNIVPYDNPYQIIAVNSRYNYIKDAIKNNFFNTEYFAWLDFSIGHIVRIPQKNLCRYFGNGIRIGLVSRFKHGKFVYLHNALIGGTFTGNKYIMKIFIDLHDREFKKIMDMGYNVNDDRLLYYMYLKYPEMFDIYNSDYGSALEKMY